MSHSTYFLDRPVYLEHYFSQVPGVFGNQQAQYLDVIKQMLHQSLLEQGSQTVSLFYNNINKSQRNK